MTPFKGLPFKDRGDYLNIYVFMFEDDGPFFPRFILATSRKEAIEKIAFEQGIHKRNAKVWAQDSLRIKQVPEFYITKIVDDRGAFI